MSRHRPSDPVELDTMPFAGMMLLLIPMLLVSAQFAALAAVDASAPAIRKAGAPPNDRINLTIAIDEAGYRISASAAALHTLGWGPEGQFIPGGPLEPAGLRALTDELDVVKDSWPGETAVILAPGDDISYAHVIAVMDASRVSDDGSELFPAVGFGSMTGGDF